VRSSKLRTPKSANPRAGIGYAQGLIIALVATALVTLFPNASDPVWADAPIITAGTYNDEVCNLEDGLPANHVTTVSAFVITGPDQLWEITDCVSATANIYFRLGADIDADLAVYAPTNSPIGFSTSSLAYSFRGVLDGAGKSITNVSMSSSTYGVGLFAALQNATVSDLALQGDFVTTNTGTTATFAAGALAITTLNTVMLRNLTNSASVSGFANVGGLVGYAQNILSFDSVHNDGTVWGTSEGVGGLVGVLANRTSISLSSNAGAISGSSLVGGLVGSLLGTNAETMYVASSRNSGTVSGTAAGVGGLIGYVSKLVSILGSSNSGRVSGQQNTGGLLGLCGRECSVQGSSNTGMISAIERVGGLVGFGIKANLNDSFNTGTVSATSQQAGGLIGYSDNPTIVGSRNSGGVAGTQSVGGLVGWTWQDLNIDSSYNTGQITGSSDYVGGLGGWVNAGSSQITESHNAGAVSGRHNVGGLIGKSGRNSNLDSSYNTGTVVGSDRVGGLVGTSNTSFYSNATFNTGAITAQNYVGGLSGYATAGEITDSYNVGAVLGTSDTGGIVGYMGSLQLTNVYSTGAVSGTSTFDALVDRVAGSLTFLSIYAGSDSELVSASAIGHMQAGELYTGWDFDNTWGFGACGYNNGLPLLRFALEVSDYYPTGCVYFASFDSQGGTSIVSQAFTASGLISQPAEPTKDGNSFDGWSATTSGALLVFPYSPEVTQSKTLYAIWTEIVVPMEGEALSPAVYSGPTSYQLDTEVVSRGTAVVLTGNNMDLVTTARAGNVALEIQEQTATFLKLLVGEGVALGSATLYLTAINGTVYRLNAFTVIEGDASASATTDASASTIIKKVNAGSFKGYVALYTLGYEGQRLSAKVGKDWVIVPSIPAATNNLYRQVEFTGAGVDCTVRIYIDRVLVRTVYLTSK
jgi:uncharacterized repeat protein (TIGR02543 family)